jgi:long-chain acyl-CoA synthetase
VLSVQRWHPRKFYTTNYYEERAGSIGSALEGVELALIDVPEKELYVHLHGEGEIIARGANVTPGYWRSEEATEQIKLGEWLRTGDIGRIDDEGNVWITGRSKFVIVLESGEKVHPDEVEEKLAESLLLEDVCVLGRKARDKTQVAAVIYPNVESTLALLEKEGLEPSEEAVRRVVGGEVDRLMAHLAPYKRIGQILIADTPLPKTPLRKVARAELTDEYKFSLQRWTESATADGAAPE